ncbi:MAG: ubiquinone/menaquinone biosynthesis methyltransferase [bacterium]|nr:ubiquinone/menaquinone biosynthesis methyltransferase [bacterium]
MSPSRTNLDKRGSSIQEMFAGVAPRYDFLNHFLSGALDISWRKRAAAALDLAPDARVLDLCCGTGDQALAVRRRGGKVIASDFCLPMLALAERKYSRHSSRRPQGIAADALVLPFDDDRFDAGTVSFGLRNVADLDEALVELHRVLRPGGQIAILEFAVPEAKWLRRPYLFYFRRILPVLGRLVSPRGSAYAYLPSSVLEFPQRAGFVRRMETAGFGSAHSRDLTGGTVCLYTGAAR